jgi:hypothetical protein
VEVETDEYRCPECGSYLRRTSPVSALWLCTAHFPMLYFRIDQNDQVIDFRLKRGGK